MDVDGRAYTGYVINSNISLTREPKKIIKRSYSRSDIARHIPDSPASISTQIMCRRPQCIGMSDPVSESSIPLEENLILLPGRCVPEVPDCLNTASLSVHQPGRRGYTLLLSTVTLAAIDGRQSLRRNAPRPIFTFDKTRKNSMLSIQT